MTVAKATGDAIPNTAIATAIASSKLFDAAVNERVTDSWQINEYAKVFGRPVFQVLLDGEQIVWCQPIRRSPCGSTDAAARELNRQVLDQDTMVRFVLSICHNCRAPRFGKTCDKEKAGMIHLEELVSSLKGINPELWEKSIQALKQVTCPVVSACDGDV